MSLYEDAAVDAATAISGMAHPLTDAQVRAEWQKAVAKYSSAPTTISKPCTFEAFLGLYKSGCIKGIPAVAGYTLVPNTNADFAVKARNILKSPTPPSCTKAALWSMVCTTQTHNRQLSVVIGLESAGWLV